MKSYYHMFKLQKDKIAKERILVHPLVFKYHQLLRKALLIWSEGLAYGAFRLYGHQIPNKEFPYACRKERWE